MAREVFRQLIDSFYFATAVHWPLKTSEISSTDKGLKSHHRVTSDLDAFEVTQSGALSTADVGGLRAAGVEGAATWGVQRVGHFALHRGAGAAGVVHFGNRVQQHLGVGVLGVAKQGVFVGQFHQSAQIHHAHPVAHMAHHGQVVADEQIRQTALALQVFHDVEHLRLHAHVERRSRLVAHQKLRRGGQCTGD